MPDRPNCTLNGLVTVSPSFGLMIYTEALGGAAVSPRTVAGAPIINTMRSRVRRNAEKGMMSVLAACGGALVGGLRYGEASLDQESRRRRLTPAANRGYFRAVRGGVTAAHNGRRAPSRCQSRTWRHDLIYLRVSVPGM